MGQTNIKKGSHSVPPTDSLGIGFDLNGNLVRINADGSETIIETGDTNPSNIIANKGVGLDADLPSGSVGDIYVAADTFKIYTAIDSVTWGSVDLVKGQFVTDVSETEELPPMYQYYNSNLMPIANYVVDLPSLPE